MSNSFFTKALKKSLSFVLCVVLIVSCWVFVAPQADAAEANYKYRLTVNTTDDVDVGDNTDLALTLHYKKLNGTGSDATVNGTASYTWAENKGSNDYDGWVSVNGFATSVDVVCVYATTVGIAREWDVTLTLYVYNNTTSKWDQIATKDCAEAGGRWGQTTVTYTLDVGSTTFPYAASPGAVTPAESTLQLNGTGDVTKTMTKPTGVDQYGVTMDSSLCTLAVAKPAYNEDEISISGRTLKATKDAHISQQYINEQTVTVTGTWAGSRTETATNAKVKIVDEKLTATYKYYEPNQSDLSSPTQKTATAQAYYGDYPTIPEVPTSYYTADNHYMDGRFTSETLLQSTEYDMVYPTTGTHSLNKRVTTPATCQHAGVTTYSCACGYSYSNDNEPAQVDHQYAANTVEPTCTEDGYTTYTCVFNCGEEYIDDEVPKLGHNYMMDEYVDPPSCEEDGYVTYKCSRCGDTYTDPIPAPGHDYEEIVVDPTCTERGYTLHGCNICGNVYEDNYVEPLGHDYQADETPATCTTAGKTVYTCSRCQDTYTEDHEALGHDLGDWIITTEPTCTEKGVRIKECSRCDYVETEDIDPLDHNYKMSVVEPTCTEQGYDLYVCQNCSDEYKLNFVDALGHKLSEWDITTAPTCTEKGEKTRSCSRCDYVEREDIDPNGHSFNEEVIQPTCTQGGYTIYTCSVCTYSYNGDFKDALDHDWASSEVTKDPTCTEKGERTYSCSRCTEKKVDPIDELGHHYNSEVIAPTCTEKGYTKYTCSRCQDTYNDDYIDETGHSFTDYYYNDDATCTEDGTETATCEWCLVATDTRTVPETKLGHIYEEEVTEPTCTEGGYTTHTCSRCKDTYTDNQTEALGHKYGDWVTTTEATCFNAGEKRRDCSRCDAYETDTIPQLEHTWELVTEEPQDQKEGHIYYHCDQCEKFANAVLTGTNEVVMGETICDTAEDIKPQTLSIDAPTFNKYVDGETSYDYATRGAALKYSDPSYEDKYTLQDTRFTASLFIPSNIDTSFSGSSENRLVDFGFVYSQTDLIDGTDKLKLGEENVYSMSVPSHNSGEISGWDGVTVHDDTFGGRTLTYNILIKIKAMNWNKPYCARAYVTYVQNGFEYTVYDVEYASRSVADIARSVIQSETETQQAKEYCQNKILNNLV